MPGRHLDGKLPGVAAAPHVASEDKRTARRTQDQFSLPFFCYCSVLEFIFFFFKKSRLHRRMDRGEKRRLKQCLHLSPPPSDTNAFPSSITYLFGVCLSDGLSGSEKWNLRLLSDHRVLI